MKSETRLVMVNSNPEHHPEGCYYIEWGSASGCQLVKTLPMQTHVARKEAELNAINSGVAVAPAEKAQMQRDEGLSDRTCHNRSEHLLTFLKANWIEKLATKRDWPKYVAKNLRVTRTKS